MRFEFGVYDSINCQLDRTKNHVEYGLLGMNVGHSLDYAN